MTTTPAAGYFTDGARINSEAKTAHDDMLKISREMLGGAVSSVLTISSGSITPTKGAHVVAVEAGSADNLDNINTTNHPDGRYLILGAFDGAKDIILRDTQGGAGQLIMADSANLNLNTINMRVILQRVGADWREIGRFYGSNVTDFRTYLGLGTAAVLNTGTAEANIPLVSEALMQGTRTIWIPANQMVARTTNGAAFTTAEFATNDIMVESFDFDETTAEAAQFTITMPKSWNIGVMTARFRWTATSGSGVVLWNIRARAVGNDDAIDNTFGSVLEIADTLLLLKDEHRSPATGTFAAAGTPADFDRVIFQVARNAGDGSDTFDQDAKLLGVELFITINDGNDD